MTESEVSPHDLTVKTIAPASPSRGESLKSSQESIDRANAEFWNELCGTNKARSLGVVDNSPESLKKFDDWFLEYYFYLHRWIPFEKVSGKKVLEVGLGYGTVLQKLCERASEYYGLDIAPGPVAMGNYRMGLVGAKGKCIRGSILDCPFEDGSFDHVISIGCLHHTGDYSQGIKEIHRLLKPGGEASLMVYYAYSYRRWAEMGKETGAQFFCEKFGIGRKPNPSDYSRARYDYDSRGVIAPETQFISRQDVRKVAKQLGFRHIRLGLELLGENRLTQQLGRVRVLNTFGRIGGRHLYINLTK
jgi:SAM-dependent methyltransferase